MSVVLGIHGGFSLNQHEPGAALCIDGEIVAACEEERFTRIKGARGMLPERAIRACLAIAKLRIEEVDVVVSPGVTYQDFDHRITSWFRYDFGHVPRYDRVHHHDAHAAAALYSSPWRNACTVTLDSTGDGACGSIAWGYIPNTNSLGAFYTAMTMYCGFEADEGEYKLMGLAAFGEPLYDLSGFAKPERDLWRIDQSFIRQTRSPFEPLYSDELIKLLGQQARQPNGTMTEHYRNVAASAQATLEACLDNAFRCRPNQELPVCYAGGVALNCSANRALLQLCPSGLYIPPVASDRGLAIGCAYLGAVSLGDTPKPLSNAYLGNEYTQGQIMHELESDGCRYQTGLDIIAETVDALMHGKAVGWYQGRSEAGARALGNRSILADPTREHAAYYVNEKVKWREPWRPFAPSVLREYAGEWFEASGEFPYMTIALKALRPEKIPAVVHVDGTSRVQTVTEQHNPRYHELLAAWYKASGVPLLLNTSFNLKGEPIVETPRDALRTFYGSGLDALIIGDFVVTK